MMKSFNVPYLGDRSMPFVVMTTAGVTVATWITYRATKWIVVGRQIEKKRSKKREECRRRINDLSARVKRRLEKQPTIDKDELERVTQLPLADLLDELKSRKISAKTVLTAFQLKAVIAHDRTHCLVEPIDEAEQWAEELDSPSLTPTGALHGLPVSIKEYFAVKGYEATMGLLKYADQPKTEDCVLVKVLKAQGAIPFVKTNVPQLCLNYTSRNPLYGITKNPRDPSRGAGGSTGGEAALVAMNGSPLGLGSDIGGSIRNPSHFCGIAGLKPTSCRISKWGSDVETGEMSNCLPSSYGPMARDVDSLVIAMKAMLTPLMFQLDRSVPPLTFRDDIYSDDRPLRIGYYFDSGLFQPVPSCQRAVHVAKDILEKQGKHQLVPWPLPKEVVELINWAGNLGKFLNADGGKAIMDFLEGDRGFDNMALAEFMFRQPRFVRILIGYVVGLFDQQMGRYLTDTSGAEDVYDWWLRVIRVENTRKAFETAWEEAGLDAVICPAFGCPAMPVDLVMPVKGEGSDLMTYNLLDIPCGVLPVTSVTADDVANMAYYPDRLDIHRIIKKGMQGAEGLPVGVQVVAPRYQEELCLRVMKEIETGLRELSAV